MRKRRQERGKNKGQPLSEKTIRDRLGDIMACLRWLKRRGDLFTELPDAPFSEIELVDPETVTPTTETVERIWAEIPFVKLGIFIARGEMGFRPSEARRLDVRDLVLGSDPELADAFVYLPGDKSKRKKERKLQLPLSLRTWFLHPEVIEAFGPIDRRFGAEPLFPNPNATRAVDRRWCASSERNTIRRACSKAGVPQIAPNQLGRHFFATSIAEAGGDIYASLKSWLGHADIKTTERYLHVRPQAIGRLDALRSGPQVDHAPKRTP